MQFQFSQHGPSPLSIEFSVQAEIFLLSDPAFLKVFDLRFHMPGHFPHGMLFSFVTCPLSQKIGEKTLAR